MNDTRNTMQQITIPSPAKLNLFLHITGRRDDGYHTLQTVFQLIDLCDELTFRLVEDDSEILVTPTLDEVPDQSNLISRAANLLREHTGTQQGIRINISKRIPIGGGLGGGSSNAATTLLALNQIWQTGLSMDELEQLGLSLGADVPIFVHGHSAWAEGVGEQIEAIELPHHWFAVVVPPCSIDTSEIFKDKTLTRNTNPIKIAAFFEGAARNDCEPVVRKRYPEVDKALTWLSQYSEAKMTGTGSCVFAEFESRGEAQKPLMDLPEGYKGFAVKGLNESPVHRILANKLG